MFAALIVTAALNLAPAATSAQQFNFDRLEQQVRQFTVIIDMKVEMSFGMNSTEQEETLLGTLVSNDGLVIFNGNTVAAEHTFANLGGMTIRTSPTKIEVRTLDGTTYDGEYIGVDRLTRIGFLRIANFDQKQLKPVSFVDQGEVKVGQWLALYMLLPEFITPRLSADVGMISTLVEEPEEFTLTVGFNPLQMTSVLFNERGQAVGVLGTLSDPSSGDMSGGLMGSFDDFGIPLLGVITAERLARMVESPPQKGEVDRGWLGITLQALTLDLIDYWNLDVAGGIIVNNIVSNSPAEEAGLEIGDIIYQVNGLPVLVDKEERLSVFQRMISDMGPGAGVEFAVLRGVETEAAPNRLTLTATLKEAPMAAADAPEYENDALEFTVRDLVFADYMFYNRDPEEFNGAVVSELQSGGLAQVGGLQIGDVIQRIGDEPVENVQDAEGIMTRIEEQKPREVIFFVWRNNKTMFVNVRTDWD